MGSDRPRLPGEIQHAGRDQVRARPWQPAIPRGDARTQAFGAGPQILTMSGRPQVVRRTGAECRSLLLKNAGSEVPTGLNWQLMRGLLSDIRYAFRTLRH